MKTNELKQGDIVGFDTGGWGEIVDNSKGDIRNVLIGGELVKVHSHNITKYLASDNQWYSVEHTTVQKVQRNRDPVYIGEFEWFGQ